VNSYADPRTLTQKAYGKSLLFPPSIHSKWIQVKPLAITLMRKYFDFRTSFGYNKLKATKVHKRFGLWINLTLEDSLNCFKPFIQMPKMVEGLFT